MPTTGSAAATAVHLPLPVARSCKPPHAGEHHHVRHDGSCRQHFDYGKHQGMTSTSSRRLLWQGPRGTDLRPAVVLRARRILDARQQDDMYGAAASWSGRLRRVPDQLPLAQNSDYPAGRKDCRPDHLGAQALRPLHVTTRCGAGSSAGGEAGCLALTWGDGSRYGMGLITLSAPMDLGWWREHDAHRGSASCPHGHDTLLRFLPFNCGKASRGTPRRHLDAVTRRRWCSRPRTSGGQTAAARGPRAGSGTRWFSELYLINGDKHGMATGQGLPTIKKWLAGALRPVD